MAQGLKPPEAVNPFSLDPESEVPLGVQLAWRLQALIVTGRLPSGDQLPSVRRLAEWAGVNVNTVRSVYERLEEDRLIVTRPGRGSFVADDVEAAPQLEEIAEEALARARAAGLDPRELAIVTMASSGMPGAPERKVEFGPPPEAEQESDVLEVRQELRRQIGRLEGELAAYVFDLPAEEAMQPITPPVSRIARVEELERIRDGLIERLSEAQRAAERRAYREARARARREAMASDPAAHRWQVVSDQEAGDPGCREHRVVPRLGPLGLAMSWWRVKVSGGCPLAPPREAADGS